MQVRKYDIKKGVKINPGRLKPMNIWQPHEVRTLMRHVRLCSNLKEALLKTAKQLKRTFASVNSKYYAYVDSHNSQEKLSTTNQKSRDMKTGNWTSEEEATLAKNIKIYPTAAEAIRKTADKLGRTENSVRIKYYGGRRKQVINKSGSKNPVVTYYNGTMRKAEVIVNNGNLIVAKMDDIVITIQY